MPQSFDITSDSETLLTQFRSSAKMSSNEKLSPSSFQQNKTRWCLFSPLSLIFHLILAATYTTLFFAFWDYRGCTVANVRKTGVNAYSPALEALRWEPRLLENALEATSPFKGPPRSELDEAWDKLLGPSSVRVSKATLERINRTSVPLRDGSGYMAGLDVYHQLHCLRYVRRYLHQDYYNMTKEKNLGQHIDHCLESLRQYIMCNADVSLLTFDWIPNFHKPWPNFRIVHECANWEAIEEWAWAHFFNGFDESLIKHPNFHPELPGPFDYSTAATDALVEPDGLQSYFKERSLAEPDRHQSYLKERSRAEPDGHQSYLKKRSRVEPDRHQSYLKERSRAEPDRHQSYLKERSLDEPDRHQSYLKERSRAEPDRHQSYL
ncbi:hypothetical protein C2857_004664 [Epichloe festucae Fl1]|uniref:Cyclochlorotine biosynthesis protein O n=1 Tax=Epichloe festucae (strain Fl1) TaxID=877507 RepID=A0A7U3Q0S0_EPIFF|nr:hypothetical protein C2857_004664 [Epichloe festucae Fl1]